MISGSGADAHVVIATIGLDMTQFPTAKQLAFWARFAPRVKILRQENRGAIGRSSSYLARVLGEAAVSAGRTDTGFYDSRDAVASASCKLLDTQPCPRTDRFSG
ncbi:hypothetical protein Acor_58270 [Acrocarpospora corrugata]|uniref:Transposase IS116/IS110/IS902 C-terminal domain-containing protein n=1 Tax=Acrocarpospora corrugata TaxID=35763 RepID=A0A5M3W9N8_9ACTN|nr:transposase [Acrocarpospora corrugata]GES03761.1 hypothetical protein Acor_58270 [Acrocarpospora corrugata]